MLTRTRTLVAPAHLVRTESPIGRLEIGSDGEAVTYLAIERQGALPWQELPENPVPVLDTAVEQLGEYFAGARRSFDVPVRLVGTPFQLSIWQALQELPFGGYTSYGALGLLTGRATAGRAVGGAVGSNPVPLLVPCHRVLASNNRITGYSGGNGIPTKRWLLSHEGIEAA